MLNLVVIWFCILNLFYRKPQGSRRFRSVLALVQHRWRVLYYRSYLCALPIGFNHSLCPCSCMFVSLLYRQRIQDSRLLYYLVREIKTWLNINHITIHTHTRMHARTHARTHTHTHTHRVEEMWMSITVTVILLLLPRCYLHPPQVPDCYLFKLAVD